MTTDAAALLAVVLIAACTRTDLLASSSPAVVAGAPPDVRRDCDLASYRCSQCHSLDRILARDPSGPDDWRATVRRMRRMPGNMIASAEETPIVTCLVYRSFGLTAAREAAGGTVSP
jgi:hypothetical protein